MATNKANTTKESKRRFDLSETVDQVKDTAKDVNNFVLETSEDVVDATITRVGQWQNVTGKAIKGGLKLAETQQDIVFDALESVKSQIVDGSKRMKSILK